MNLNIDLLIPIISQVLNKDLSSDWKSVQEAKEAILSSVDEQGAEFVSQNWRYYVSYMGTDEGKKIIALFLESGARALIPKPPVEPETEHKSIET